MALSTQISVDLTGVERYRLNVYLYFRRQFHRWIIFPGAEVGHDRVNLLIVQRPPEGASEWGHSIIRLTLRDNRSQSEIISSFQIITGTDREDDIPGAAWIGSALAKIAVAGGTQLNVKLLALLHGAFSGREAMAVGTPVIVSRVSSLPEICGDVATYIEDPYSIESIRSALENININYLF